MSQSQRADRPEVWAGVESTLNRVGDSYFAQLQRSGHDSRPDDIDRLAALGVSAVRYPVLWEQHYPDPNWQWAKDRLNRLRKNGVAPIVGLVHHGSGPPHTSLTDPAFAEGLSCFATEVAQQFPWVESYTPVNEPLTTARFSGLYGHWYPHGHDTLTFLKCLLIECRATVLAMQAIRRINPAARLIQTEDLGQTHAPPRLAYQAEFENERRWLSWDLLCGRVNCDHSMRSFFRWAGIPDEEVDWFLDNPCPPDVLGINYYVTSERYLDDRVSLYPSKMHGGNGRDSYVDVEAVRILESEFEGFEGILRQAWARYNRPLAITEVQLGCTREEQLRWLRDAWLAACRARASGADVRAITAWSAFGAFDWDSLVTRQTGTYEVGLFDVRTHTPRPTALASFLCSLASGHETAHPASEGPGWWERPECLLHGACKPAEHRAGTPCILVTGANGRLGRVIGRLCQIRGLRCILLSRDELDIADRLAVAEALNRYQPWAVVNAAGYVRLDEAELEETSCYRTNALGPEILAAACSIRQIRLLTFSSALVFDGLAHKPYCEGNTVSPINVYGRTKATGEKGALAQCADSLIIRTSGLFGPWDDLNFVARVISTLRGGALFPAADDITLTPCYAPDLVNTALDLLIDGERGIWHLAHPDPITWAGFAGMVAVVAGLDPALVEPRPAATLSWKAPRPRYAPLASEHGSLLPSLSNAVERYVCAAQVEEA